MSVTTHCARHVGLCIIPKPENDYRPLAMRHGPLAFISALLIATKVLTIGAIALTPATAELSTITVARITQLTNAERKKAGLNELKINPTLSQAAQMKGEDMLKHDYFAHISPTGVTPWFWINKVGYTYEIAGENLAIDFTEAEDVVAAWLASPTHKENMLLSSYTETGIAVVSGEFQGNTSTVVVHMFGLPAGTTSSIPPAPAQPKVESGTTEAAPSPTPAPASPTPTAAPAIPRTPRIALDSSDGFVSNVLKLRIAGEPGTTVHIMVNEQDSGTVKLDQAEATHEIPVKKFPDGMLAVRAYASRPGTTSESDKTQPVTVTKDTAAPDFEREAFSIAIAPDTDTPHALITLDPTVSDNAELVYNGTVTPMEQSRRASVPVVGAATISLNLKDRAGNNSSAHEVELAPKFDRSANNDFVRPPARLSKASRWLIAIISLIILTLLMITIFVRVSIQRPALITHAAGVLILALTFLLW